MWRELGRRSPCLGGGENVPGSSRKALEEFLRALMSEALKAPERCGGAARVELLLLQGFHRVLLVRLVQ